MARLLAAVTQEEASTAPDLRPLDANATATGSVGPRVRRIDEATVSPDLFEDVPPYVRLQLELVARASKSPETALPHALKILVPDSKQAHEAIRAAFTENPALREQWERAWAALRR